MNAASQPTNIDPSARKVCVIGAGLGGLALAIRLQAAGLAVTLVEARSEPGGCLRRWHRDGFIFEEGPGEITDPAALRELWSLTGEDLADQLTLHEIAPICRYSWSDGSTFDLALDPGEQSRQLGRLAPGDIAGFDEFLTWSAAAHGDGWQRLAQEALPGPAAALRALPALVRNQGWRSAWGQVSRLVQSGKLREALAFPALLSGANPFAASALTLLGQAGAGRSAWWPEGGMGRLVEVLAARFEALGGVLRLHDPVIAVQTIGNRASEVRCQSGWRQHCDALASNADVVHTYRDLLGETPRGQSEAASLREAAFAPSAFTLHFALEGSWPGIPHRQVLLGPQFRDLADDLFEHGVLPHDSPIVLTHPSVTDPGMAPPGKSVLSATVPVANLGQLPIDWEAVRPLIETRVLTEIGRRLIPDLGDRIVMRFSTTPRDLALELNLHLGSAWGLAATARQSGPLRPAHRDRKLPNVYLVGASTHPGAGLAAVLAGAKATAGLMLEELT